MPRLWIGFLLALCVLLGELLATGSGDDSGIGALAAALSFVGVMYWLSCVQRFHTILRQIAPQAGGRSTYPYSARQAVLRHFLPLYNLYWVFRWPREMARFLDESSPGRMISGTALGALIFFALVLWFVEGFLGLSMLFTVSSYMASRLRQAMEEHERIRGAAGIFA